VAARVRAAEGPIASANGYTAQRALGGIVRQADGRRSMSSFEMPSLAASNFRSEHPTQHDTLNPPFATDAFQA
jgi:hypothetical protein